MGLLGGYLAQKKCLFRDYAGISGFWGISSSSAVMRVKVGEPRKRLQVRKCVRLWVRGC